MRSASAISIPSLSDSYISSSAPATGKSIRERIGKLMQTSPESIDSKWTNEMEDALNALPFEEDASLGRETSRDLLDVIRNLVEGGNHISSASDPSSCIGASDDNRKVAITLSRNSRRRNLQIEIATIIHVGRDIACGQCKKSAPIPFDIGMKLLADDTVDIEENGRTLEEELQVARQEAMRKGLRAISSEQQIEILAKHMKHWKKLAQRRLELLAEEIEFRNRMMFGAPRIRASKAQTLSAPIRVA